MKISGPNPRTQAGKILVALRAAWPCWLDAWRLFELSRSLALHSRIADLRKLGWQIENNGRKNASAYRLMDKPPPPKFEMGSARGCPPPALKEEKTNVAEQCELLLPKSSPPAARYGIPD